MGFSGQIPAARRAAACAASSKRVVERGELGGVATQRGGGEPVREPAVLGQQRAMQIGTEDGAVRTTADALVTGAAVIPMTAKDASEWALRRSQAGAAAVVLEAGEHPRQPAEVDLDGDVADQPRAVLAHGLEVDQADARQPLTSEFVGVAEQLVAAADGEDQLSGVGGGVQRLALDGRQILGAQRLVAVLAAADVEEVVGVGVERVAEAGAGELEAEPAPLAALAQQREVAAVGVDVHQVRIQRADAQAVSHGRPPPGRPRARASRGCGAAPRRAGRARRPPRPGRRA